MKKIIFMCTIMLLLTGCSEENLYADYEHYDLKGKEVQYYECLDNERIKRTYAIADITPEEYESHLRGLFYQVGENDYILLDTIELPYYEEQNSRGYNIIYDNKLYVRGASETAGVNGDALEYTLNREKFTIKEIDFQYPTLPEGKDLASLRFKNIDHNCIYLYNYSMGDDTYIKCSLEDYTCEYVED